MTMGRHLQEGGLAILFLVVGFFGGITWVAFNAPEPEPEVIEVERKVVVPGPERVVTKKVEVEVPAEPLPCTACAHRTQQRSAKDARLEQLEEDIGALYWSEFDHPATGLTYIQQVKLQLVFERTKATAEQIMTGQADRPNPVAVDAVTRLLGDAEVDRLRSVLEEEFRRSGSDHVRWRVTDPFAQRLYAVLRL